MNKKYEILIKNLLKDKNYDDNFVKTYENDVILAIEEYGKQMYNQAINDVLEEVYADYHREDTTNGVFIEPFVVLESITKLIKT